VDPQRTSVALESRPGANGRRSHAHHVPDTAGRLTVRPVLPAHPFPQSPLATHGAAVRENISRIVPPGFEPETPHAYAYDGVDIGGLLDDVRELRSLKFIRDEASGQALASVTNEFFDFYTTNLMDPQKRAALVPALARHR